MCTFLEPSHSETVVFLILSTVHDQHQHEADISHKQNREEKDGKTEVGHDHRGRTNDAHPPEEAAGASGVSQRQRQGWRRGPAETTEKPTPAELRLRGAETWLPSAE